ncbi:MAG: hypothetical protein R6X20_01270 [Phycisphaerae bacterium]
MRALRRTLSALALCAIVCAPTLVHGARITTKAQQTFVGSIVEETPTQITIATASGKITVPITSIVNIVRDTKPDEKKIVPEKVKPTKAQEAFQNAKSAIGAGNWVKGGSLLAGLLELPASIFRHEQRLAATAALATCHLQISDTDGAAQVFRRRANLVASESDKKRLLATAEALEAAQTAMGVSQEWQFVQTYDDATAAGTKWKAEQLLETAKGVGEDAEGLNKWTTMKRVGDKIMGYLDEADLFVPGFAEQHREAALSTVADNVVQAAEKAVAICTEERKFNITPYYETSASSVKHALVYNEYVTRYLSRREAAEDALKNLSRLAQEHTVPDLVKKRQEKINALLTQLDELRYHLKIHGMRRQLRITLRRIGSQF